MSKTEGRAATSGEDVLGRALKTGADIASALFGTRTRAARALQRVYKDEPSDILRAIERYGVTSAAGQAVSPFKPQDDEAKFQSWIRSTPWFSEFVKEYGEEPDLNTGDYNYRAAWRAGIKPERDPYDNNRYHWPSSLPSGEMLKAPDHPTAWKENFMRQTGKNPDALGLRDQPQADQWLKQRR